VTLGAKTALVAAMAVGLVILNVLARRRRFERFRDDRARRRRRVVAGPGPDRVGEPPDAC
jgi:hypothetical protein